MGVKIKPTKVCSKCKLEKSVNEFYRRGDKPSACRSVCRRCYLDGRNASRANKKQHVKRYGLTIEIFDAMVIAQENKCAICGLNGSFSAKGSLAIDHCHTTGKVRGLLCGRCNYGIGQFSDSPALLRSAAAYLESN